MNLNTIICYRCYPLENFVSVVCCIRFCSVQQVSQLIAKMDTFHELLCFLFADCSTVVFIHDIEMFLKLGFIWNYTSVFFQEISQEIYCFIFLQNTITIIIILIPNLLYFLPFFSLELFVGSSLCKMIGSCSSPYFICAIWI